MSLVITPVQLSNAMELENLSGHACKLFLQLDKISSRYQHYWSGLPNFPDTVSSAALDSVQGASVSMIVVRRGGVKKLLAFISTDALGSAAFFEVGAVSSVLRVFLLRTTLKQSTCFL
jgi:hypothetical protein